MTSLTLERDARSPAAGRAAAPAAIALGLVLALAPWEARGQEPTPSARPRIGLVLSGGSARGMAHAGVMQWLEEHRVPVDRIAGNSTGALMGASYAIGLSPDDIKTMLRTADWDTILRPDIPYPLKSYRRKEDDRDYAIKIEAGLRHGFRLQSGINPGHHLSLKISRILLDYSGVANFDDLPIPFRCVATDLEKGEIVVFDHGPIAPAVRASMSLPGTYDPVRIDGRLFADGGILDNVPVDVAKDMGADVVIAVRVGPKPEENVPETIAGVANRAITLMMQTLEKPRLQRADVVILPDLEGLTAADFKKSDEFAARGYQAAEARKEALLRYALDPEAWRKYRAEIDARRRPGREPVTFMEVTGVGDGAVAQIAAQLSRHIGTVPKAEEVELDLNRIVGLGRYASATYGRRVIADTVGLGVQIRDKSYGPPFVRFSLDVSNEGRDFNLNLGSRLTFMDLTGLGSEWRIDAAMGSAASFATEFYQPLGGERPVHGGPFASPHASYTRSDENLYADGELLTIYGRQRAGAGLDVGWNSEGRMRFRAGYDVAYMTSVARVGDPPLPRSSGGEQVLRARFDYDGRDAAYLAGRGVRVNGTAQWFLRTPDASRRFGTIEGGMQAARAVRGRQVLSIGVEGGSTFGGAPPILYQFGLGGPFRLGAFPSFAFRGSKYALAGLGYRIPVGSLPSLLGGRLYVETLAEMGSAFESLSGARIKSSLSAGLAADTLLGPFFAGGSVGSGGETRVYFMIGRRVR
jgi:NTE family protein